MDIHTTKKFSKKLNMNLIKFRRKSITIYKANYELN